MRSGFITPGALETAIGAPAGSLRKWRMEGHLIGLDVDRSGVRWLVSRSAAVAIALAWALARAGAVRSIAAGFKVGRVVGPPVDAVLSGRTPLRYVVAAHNGGDDVVIRATDDVSEHVGGRMGFGFALVIDVFKEAENVRPVLAAFDRAEAA